MENPISISKLNDFIFCPISIYFHNLDEETQTMAYQSKAQLDGKYAHEKVDSSSYSDKKSILQAIWIYSLEYNLVGKIDLFDCEKGVLTERKNKITTIYDGYIFQLYAQYFCLTEMGYTVSKLRFHSIKDNKIHNVKLPKDDIVMFNKFEKLLSDINSFNFNCFKQTNVRKCENCIYENLCSFSLLKG